MKKESDHTAEKVLNAQNRRYSPRVNAAENVRNVKQNS